MRISRTAASGIAAVLLLAFAVAGQTSEPRRITVTAKKFEFQPSRIELKVGEPVEITFESEDTKHGFACKDLNLEKIEFSRDSPGKVAFTPDKAGTFAFKCAKFCGLGHSKMKGEFVVAP